MSTYSNQTLVANWYEDRLDQRLDSHGNKVAARLLRTGNFAEAPIKMKRPVDNVHLSLAHDTYRKPVPERPSTHVSLCNSNTIKYTLEKHAAYNLPKHGPERTIHELATTTHSEFGGLYAADPARRPSSRPTSRQGRTGAEIAYAGATSRPQRPYSGPSNTAIGEKLMISQDVDAKNNTFVQRSWRYTSDQGVYGREKRDGSDWSQNLPGLGMKGVGIENPRPISLNNSKRNDALSDQTGIWSG